MNRRTLVPAAIVVAAAFLTVGLLVGRFTATTPAPAPPSSAPSSSPAPSSSTLPSSPAAATPSVPPQPTDEGAGPDAGDASLGATPYSKTTAARRQWEPVVVGFAKNFVRPTPDDKTWAARLAPYTTPALQQQLATVDRRRVPAGRYTEYRPLSYDEEQVTVQVDYAPGWSLALSVISNGETWHVYQYDRYEN